MDVCSMLLTGARVQHVFYGVLWSKWRRVPRRFACRNDRTAEDEEVGCRSLRICKDMGHPEWMGCFLDKDVL